MVCKMDLLSSMAMLGIHAKFQGGKFGDCLQQSGMEKKTTINHNQFLLTLLEASFGSVTLVHY